MKATTITLAILAAALLPAAAVQYSLSASNFNTVTGDTIITTSNGVPIPVGTGFVGMGSFATDPADMAPSEIAEGFNVLLSGSLDASILIGVPIPGMFALTGDVDSADANVVDAGDRDVFVVFGNSSDLASATEVGVVKVPGRTFQSDFSGPPPFALTGLQFVSQPPIHGTYGAGVRVVGDGYDLTTGASFRMVAVPEPSAAHLLGLVGFTLAARQRRTRSTGLND